LLVRRILTLTYGRFTSLSIQKRNATVHTSRQLPDKIMCLQPVLWHAYWHVRFKWGSMLILWNVTPCLFGTTRCFQVQNLWTPGRYVIESPSIPVASLKPNYLQSLDLRTTCHAASSQRIIGRGKTTFDRISSSQVQLISAEFPDRRHRCSETK
jgi:hypothetical protein